MKKIITFIVNNKVLFAVSNFILKRIVAPMKKARAFIKRDIFKTKSKLEEFMNINKGKRCFIIGNGPSLTMEDLEKIKDEISFGFNMIYLSFDKTKWRPTYYMVLDQNVYLEVGKELNTIDIPYKFVGENCKKYGKHINNAIYFPTIFSNKTMPEYSDDITKYMYDGNTVAYYSLQMATYMGFEEIYMIGFDCTYSREIDNDGNVINNDVKDHFDDAYNDNHNYSNVDKMILAFRSASIYAKENNVKIYNATRGGKLEEFERINFDDIKLT